MSHAAYYSERAAKYAKPKAPELEPMREAVRLVLRTFPGARIESYGPVRR